MKLPARLRACALCHRDRAEGFAFINGKRYCHPEHGSSCYETEIEVRPGAFIGFAWEWWVGWQGWNAPRLDLGGRYDPWGRP